MKQLQRIQLLYGFIDSMETLDIPAIINKRFVVSFSTTTF